jgi:hypothetical protein
MDLKQLIFEKDGSRMTVSRTEGGFLFETSKSKFIRRHGESIEFLTSSACESDPDFATASEQLKNSHRGILNTAYAGMLNMLS